MIIFSVVRRWYTIPFGYIRSEPNWLHHTRLVNLCSTIYSQIEWLQAKISSQWLMPLNKGLLTIYFNYSVCWRPHVVQQSRKDKSLTCQTSWCALCSTCITVSHHRSEKFLSIILKKKSQISTVYHPSWPFPVKFHISCS